ncbi:MAG: hypothetical protein CSA65_01435 [Proteobacteria bacterium]|nr:MAG: hypothetical protein CSB49_03105 [Pseudomonadota bacterium]PIE19674.1 MAG: hypothetical protein CSA65_01435 [Pseudomonadota bacterium]
MSADDDREPPNQGVDEAPTTTWQQRQEFVLELPPAPPARPAPRSRPTLERANAPRNSDYELSERSLAESGPAPLSPNGGEATPSGASGDRGLGLREHLDIPKAPRRRQPGRVAVLISVLASIIAGVGYLIESQWGEGGLFSPRDDVLLLVMLHPKGAKLFADGEWQESTSLQLPRARGKVVLRAEAEGYRTRQLVVDLATTRVVTLRLERSRGRTTKGASRKGKRAGRSGSVATMPTIRPVIPDSPGPKPQAVDDEKAPIE